MEKNQAIEAANILSRLEDLDCFKESVEVLLYNLEDDRLTIMKETIIEAINKEVSKVEEELKNL